MGTPGESYTWFVDDTDEDAKKEAADQARIEQFHDDMLGLIRIGKAHTSKPKRKRTKSKVSRKTTPKTESLGDFLGDLWE